VPSLIDSGHASAGFAPNPTDPSSLPHLPGFASVADSSVLKPSKQTDAINEEPQPQARKYKTIHPCQPCLQAQADLGDSQQNLCVLGETKRDCERCIVKNLECSFDSAAAFARKKIAPKVRTPEPCRDTRMKLISTPFFFKASTKPSYAAWPCTPCEQRGIKCENISKDERHSFGNVCRQCLPKSPLGQSDGQGDVVCDRNDQENQRRREKQKAQRKKVPRKPIPAPEKVRREGRYMPLAIKK
jgi:hypothetical protein